MTALPADTDIADKILELCRERGPDKTICPSEAARAMTGAEAGLGWRELMGDVRRVAGRLAAEGRIDVRQRGEVVDIAEAKGPIRLGIVKEIDRKD